MKLDVVSDHTAPYVFYQVILHTGSLADPVGREGCAQLVGQALTYGTANRPRDEFMESLDQLGASLDVSVFREFTVVEGEVLTRHLDALVDLMVEALAEPRFDPDEMERLRRRTIAELLQIVDHDESLVGLASQHLAWGAHPYGRPSRGTPSTLDGLGVEDLRAHYRQHLVCAPRQFAAAGDIDPERALQIARRVDAALEPPRARADEVGLHLGLPDRAAARRVLLVDKPERTQTQIAFAQPTLAAPHPEFLALSVACSALGGTFTSRLMRVIREEHGWSYGAYSRVGADRHTGVFSVRYYPGAAETSLALRAGRDLIASWAKDGITAEELEFNQSYLTQAFAFALETASKRLGTRLEAELTGRDAEWVERFEERVLALDCEQTNRAARQHVEPQGMSLAMVCTADQFRDEWADWSDVERVDVVDYDDIWSIFAP